MENIGQLIINFFEIPPTLTEYIICGVFLVAFIYQIYYYSRYMAGINRRLRRVRKGKVKLSDELPPVSVIICGRNEEENLRTFLTTMLAQDYPEYEVIVVDDSSEDGTREYLGQLAALNKKLRYTFVPRGPYWLSTKKLAITLGIKAAKYEHLLFTDADCYPENDKWIRSMVKGFTPGTDIVLGFGAYEQQKSHINRLIAYDTLWNGMQYLGQALSGHPYMGVGRNMAYTKSLFHNNKGFTGHLQVLAGDDDLFVNQVATRSNTNIMVGMDSLTWSIPKTSLDSWFDQKRRHIGVSVYYRFGTKLRLFAEPFTRGLCYLSLILACVLCRPYIWASVLFLLLVRYIVQISIINRTAKQLQQTRFHINLIWFDIILPLINMLLVTITRLSPKRRNRW